METVNPPDKQEWARAMRGADLGLAEQAVAFRLMGYANADGTKAHPGVENLVADTRSSDKTVRRALKRLEQTGWIRCVHQGRRNAGASEYRLTVPKDRAHMMIPRVPKSQGPRAKKPEQWSPGNLRPSNHPSVYSELPGYGRRLR